LSGIDVGIHEGRICHRGLHDGKRKESPDKDSITTTTERGKKGGGESSFTSEEGYSQGKSGGGSFDSGSLGTRSRKRKGKFRQQGGGKYHPKLRKKERGGGMKS